MDSITRPLPLDGIRGNGSPSIASPQAFYHLAGRCAPWFMALALVLCAAGLYAAFFLAPSEARQGEAYRIIFVHVPAAWLSLLIYLLMAASAGTGFVTGNRPASMLANALAPTGAMFTFLALWTGALWGKPTWGAWWVWDARLTSELLLLFVYLGYIALQSSIDDPRRADRASGVLALLGVVNVPIVFFSVQWWQTLHQGASLSLSAAPAMAGIMALGITLMVLALLAYTIAVALFRVRNVILERERHLAWVSKLSGDTDELG